MPSSSWYSSVSFYEQAGIEPHPQALYSSISVEEVAIVVETDTAVSSPPLEVNAPTKARHTDMPQLLQVVSWYLISPLLTSVSWVVNCISWGVEIHFVPAQPPAQGWGRLGWCWLHPASLKAPVSPNTASLSSTTWALRVGSATWEYDMAFMIRQLTLWCA